MCMVVDLHPGSRKKGQCGQEDSGFAWTCVPLALASLPRPKTFLHDAGVGTLVLACPANQTQSSHCSRSRTGMLKPDLHAF